MRVTTAEKPAVPSWRPAHAVGERRSHRRWVPLVAGVLTFLLGVRDIAMVVRPHLWERVKVIDHVLPGKIDPAVVHGAVGAALVVAGALLILLSHALRRRKRRAWRAVVAILVVTATLHFLHGPITWRETVDWLPLDAVFVVALVLYRKEFFAVGDPRTRWLAVWAFLGLTAGSFVLGALLIEVRPDEVIGSVGFVTVAQHVLYGLVGVSGPIHFHSDRTSDLITWTLATMGAFTALTTVYLLFRPAEPGPAWALTTKRRCATCWPRTVNSTPSATSHCAATRASSGRRRRKSCIAYRVLSGVMLATGDPLGDPEAWPGAIKEFMIEAERHAWVPAVLACSELGGDVWTRETEMSALEFGDEAIVDVERVQSRRSHDAQRAADGESRRARRLHGRDLPGARSDRRRCRRCSGGRPSRGAARRPNAVIRWPSVASAIPPTATASRSLP